jgi:hypothetical protein
MVLGDAGSPSIADGMGLFYQGFLLVLLMSSSSVHQIGLRESINWFGC